MPKEILVAREKDAFSEILIERGFSVVNLPLIKTAPLADLSEFRKELENIDSFDGVFITSVSATEIFLSELADAPFGGTIYAFGKRSADLTKAANLKTFDGGADAKTASQFLDSIPRAELERKKFLIVRGTRSLRAIADALEKIADAREAIVYETVAADASEEKIFAVKEKFARGAIGAICFFSPSGAEEFLKRFENFAQGEIKIAAVGETTARFIEANNLRANFVSPHPTAKDFALKLIEFLKT